MASTWGGVLLGICDGVGRANVQLSPYDSKIGGYPDFFAVPALDSPPLCRCCGSPVLLLAQVYCPLVASPYHRILHVFCCGQRPCWPKTESWLVLRSQLRDPTYQLTPPTNNPELPPGQEATHGLLSVSDWCEAADDWGSEFLHYSHTETHFDSELTSGVAEVLDRGKEEFCPLSEDTDTSLTSQLEQLSLNSEREPQPTPSPWCYQGPFFPASFVNVVEEPSEDGSLNPEVQDLLQKYRLENPEEVLESCPGQTSGYSGKKGRERRRNKQGQRKAGPGDGSSEGYERSVARHGDRTFQKFYKHLSKCPQQVLRYSWKGDPLMVTDNPAVRPPPPETLRCKSCGSPCVFEFQLMPQLVYIIQKAMELDRLASESDQGSGYEPGKGVSVSGSEYPSSRVSSPGVEFATVLVYTCSESCWNEGKGEQGLKGFVEEHVFVQSDPDDATVHKITHDL